MKFLNKKRSGIDMYNFKVGDYVAFSWRQYCYDRYPNIILDYEEDLILKGTIKEVRTKKFLFFKMENPSYKVCNCWVKTIKPILKVKDGEIIE